MSTATILGFFSFRHLHVCYKIFVFLFLASPATISCNYAIPFCIFLTNCRIIDLNNLICYEIRSGRFPKRSCRYRVARSLIAVFSSLPNRVCVIPSSTLSFLLDVAFHYKEQYMYWYAKWLLKFTNQVVALTCPCAAWLVTRRSRLVDSWSQSHGYTWIDSFFDNCKVLHTPTSKFGYFLVGYSVKKRNCVETVLTLT